MSVKKSMSFKPVSTSLAAVLLVLAGAAHAQVLVGGSDWKESEAPPPPAFDVNKLLTFDVSPGSTLVFGVDPASVSISRSDSLVRYVMVATSGSGAKNVMYEALRCTTGEFKTYARYNPDGRWVQIANAQWRSMFGNPTNYALQFAKAGACDSAAPPNSVAELVNKLKNPGPIWNQ